MRNELPSGYCSAHQVSNDPLCETCFPITAHLHAQLAALTAERDSERRRKEHYQRTAYSLETTLQACSQRLNCEPDGRVVVELDKLLSRCDRMSAYLSTHDHTKHDAAMAAAREHLHTEEP